MDLGRPIARHFARRPHESDDAAVTTTDPDRPVGLGPTTQGHQEKPVEVTAEPEPGTPPFGRAGT